MPKGHSLHIGLNRVDPQHYRDRFGNPWDGALAACVFDAQDMQAIADSMGYTSQILLDDQATADAVTGAIAQAAEELVPGDIFFLSYAGHGAQVPDTNGDEEDDMDETWCCFDRQLVDDELADLWGKFQPGVRILMLSDSCHSGTVAKDPDLEQAASGHGAPRVLPADVQASTFRNSKDLYTCLQAQIPPAREAEIGASILLLSGCQDNQTSRDGKKNGLFTGTLLDVWSEGNFTGDYVRFWKTISEKMPFYQSPNYFQSGTPNPEFERQQPFAI